MEFKLKTEEGINSGFFSRGEVKPLFLALGVKIILIEIVTLKLFSWVKNLVVSYPTFYERFNSEL